MPYRLVAAALALLSVSLAAAGYVVADRWTRAERARSLASSIDRLSELVRVETALLAEAVQTDAVQRMAQTGFDAAATSELLGVPVDGDTDEVRAATDAALDEAGAGSGIDRQALAWTRASLDAGTIAAAPSAGAFDDFTDPVEQRIAARLGSVAEAVVQSGDAALADRVEALAATLDLISNVDALSGTLTEYWLGTEEQRRVAPAELARGDAIVSEALDRIAERGTPGLRARVRRVLADSASFRAAIVDTESSLPRAAAPAELTVRLGRLLGEGARMGRQVRELPLMASQAVETRSHTLANDLESEARLASLTAAGTTLVTVGLAVGLGRSISRPVRRLTDHARAIGTGTLAKRPVERRAPRDIAAAAEALNDVAAVLVLLNAKVEALAELRLDAPVLDHRLPGPLGDALARSHRTLSGSIAEHSRLRDRLLHVATHDPLTELPNRAAALDAITRAGARARRSQSLAAAVYCDLDAFKRVNEAFGPATGDAVLQVVGHRLATLTNGAGFVARVGDDEFLVLVDSVRGLTEATTFARDLLDRVAEPISLDGRNLVVTASAGIVLGAELDGDAHDVLARADMAVHRAKANGSDCLATYDDELQHELLKRVEMEAALRRALDEPDPERSGLSVVFQPMVDAATFTPLAVEALTRWHRPGIGPVAPEEFVAVAEESDLVCVLDRWVLGRATAWLATLLRSGALGATSSDLSVSVNISGRHVANPSFVSDVRAALRDSGLDAHRLMLEITETVLLRDLDAIAERLQEVRALGVRVSVDDFGTGYASLGTLLALPVDELKIDGSFTSDLSRPDARRLVRVVNDLARVLSLPTVAEGVESGSAARVLAQCGCDVLQGYFFARPMPSDECAEWLRGRTLVAPI